MLLEHYLLTRSIQSLKRRIQIFKKEFTLKYLLELKEKHCKMKKHYILSGGYALFQQFPHKSIRMLLIDKAASADEWHYWLQNA